MLLGKLCQGTSNKCYKIEASYAFIALSLALTDRVQLAFRTGSRTAQEARRLRLWAGAVPGGGVPEKYCSAASGLSVAFFIDAAKGQPFLEDKNLYRDLTGNPKENFP